MDLSWSDLTLPPINLWNAPKMFTPQEITHVAIVYNGTLYSLPKPNRHHHVIRLIGGIKGHDIQGFLLADGTFVNRREAFSHANLSGQLARRMGAGTYQGTELYSEDLW